MTKIAETDALFTINYYTHIENHGQWENIEFERNQARLVSNFDVNPRVQSLFEIDGVYSYIKRQNQSFNKLTIGGSMVLSTLQDV